MRSYTRFTNVEVTDELKAKTVNVDGLTVDGVDDITAPTDAGDDYSKAQVQSVVDAVNGILALLGKSSD
jgi:hypothetical protein